MAINGVRTQGFYSDVAMSGFSFGMNQPVTINHDGSVTLTSVASEEAALIIQNASDGFSVGWSDAVVELTPQPAWAIREEPTATELHGRVDWIPRPGDPIRVDVFKAIDQQFKEYDTKISQLEAKIEALGTLVQQLTQD